MNRDCSFVGSLCLVSRLWLHPAQRSLYRVVPILQRDLTRLLNFCAAVRHNPALRLYVRRFHTSITSEDTWRLTLEVCELLPRCVVFLIDPVFGLRAGSDLFADQVMSDLPLLPHLASVRLASVSWLPHLWVTAFSTWTELEYLVLGNMGVPLELDFHTDEYLPSLKTLQLWHTSTSYLIPPTTSNTLHTLVLINCPCITGDSFRLLVSKHRNSLRRLAIQRYNIDTLGFDYVEAASLARKLECFKCHDVNTASLRLLSPCITEAIFSSISDFADPEDIIAYLHLSPCLKTLLCRMWMQSPNSPAQDEELWRRVQDAAEERGIIFGCCYYNSEEIASGWARGSQNLENPSWAS
jgi:hypothetical protein